MRFLFPSAFAVSGACISQAFRAWHSPLLRFLIASAVFASCGLSSLFHLETLLGFSFRAFSCKRLVASSCRDFVASRSSVRLLSLAATRSCSRVGCVNRVLTTALQFDFRGFSLLQLVPPGQWLVGFDGRCSPGFHSSSGVLFFVLRSPCDDLHRCNTSVTSPALTVYTGLFLPLLALWPSLASAGWLHSTPPRLASSFTRSAPLTL